MFIFRAIPKFLFLKRDWGLCYTCNQFWNFPKVSPFPKILRLKSFYNSWGNSQIKLLVIKIYLLVTLPLAVNSNYVKTWKSLRYGILSSVSHFFKSRWKLQTRFCLGGKTLDLLIMTALLQLSLRLVLNWCLNIKHKIVLFEYCQIQPSVTFPLLWVSNLTKNCWNCNFPGIWTDLWSWNCFLTQSLRKYIETNLRNPGK